MKICVTGSTGYIGSVLCDYLRWRGHRVSRTDDLSVASRSDAMVHLAGSSKVGPCLMADAEIDFVRRARFVMGRRIVYASSCAVYGDATCEQDESIAPSPVCEYGSLKLACERLVLDVGGTSIRCGAACGPSPAMRFDLAVNGMVNDAVRHGRIAVYGPDDWRPHVHILDVCACYAAAVEGRICGVVNCVSWNATMLDVAVEINRLTGATIESYPSQLCRSYRVIGSWPTTIDMKVAIYDLSSMFQCRPCASAEMIGCKIKTV